MPTFAKTLVSSKNIPNISNIREDVCEDMRYEIYRQLDPVSRLLIDFDTDGRMLRILNPHLRFMIPRTLSMDDYCAYIMLYIIAGRFEQLLPDLEDYSRKQMSSPGVALVYLSPDEINRLKEIHRLSKIERIIALYETRYFACLREKIIKMYGFGVDAQGNCIQFYNASKSDIHEMLVGITCLRKFYSDFYSELPYASIDNWISRISYEFQSVFIALCGVLLNPDLNPTRYPIKMVKLLIDESMNLIHSFVAYEQNDSIVLSILQVARKQRFYKQNILDMFCKSLLQTHHYCSQEQLEILELMSPELLAQIVDEKFLLKACINMVFEDRNGLIYYNGEMLSRHVRLVNRNWKLRHLLNGKEIKHLLKCVDWLQRWHKQIGITHDQMLNGLMMDKIPPICDFTNKLAPQAKALIREYLF
jgi:hypothetical protein